MRRLSVPVRLVPGAVLMVLGAVLMVLGAAHVRPVMMVPLPAARLTSMTAPITVMTANVTKLDPVVCLLDPRGEDAADHVIEHKNNGEGREGMHSRHGIADGRALARFPSLARRNEETMVLPCPGPAA